MSTVSLADLIASMGTDKRYDVFMKGGKPLLFAAKVIEQDEHEKRNEWLSVRGKEPSGKIFEWVFTYEVINVGGYEFREHQTPPLW